MSMLDEDEEYEDEVLYERRGTPVLRSARAPRARRAHTLDELALAWSPKFEVMASSMRCDGVARLDDGRAASPVFRPLSWVVSQTNSHDQGPWFGLS
jgi:hypothetical protein